MLKLLFLVNVVFNGILIILFLVWFLVILLVLGILYLIEIRLKLIVIIIIMKYGKIFLDKERRD